MKVFQLTEKILPTPFPWLFFRHEYLAAQSSDVIYSFILTSKDNDRILAVFNYAHEAVECLSCPLAPFGGILPLENCLISELTFLLTCVRKWAAAHGAKRLTVRTAPVCYAPDMHILCHAAYLNSGFYPNHTYSNHYIPIQAHPFIALIEPSEMRRLLKGKRLGLHITAQSGLPDLSSIHFLQGCYNARDYKMPVSAERLQKLAGIFPDTFLTLITRNNDRPVAMAVMVNIGCGVLYHFMSGYLPDYAGCSPSLLLFEAAYEFCQRKGMRILDLGISIDQHGKFKPSLSRFKEKIGGMVCEKVVYSTEC